MHIPEGQSSDAYIATEKLWQRLHQRAVDAGICLSWTLYKVENGGRTDFATVRVYNSPDKMSNPWPDSVTKEYMKPKPGKSTEYYNREKNTYSKIHQADRKSTR